jgi:DNA uptake protein ComE-like DNA-binding protein
MGAGFSKREVRGLLWLLPALAVVSWLVWEISRAPRVDDASLPPIEADSLNFERPTLDEVVADGVARDSLPQLFEFDPNTVEYHDLVRLGFTRGEALGIVKYRERGKVFEIPEDFAACYQVSEAMYRRLRPYITIGERFRLKKFERREPTHTPISRQSGADAALTEGRGDRDSTHSTALATSRGSAAGAPLSREILIDLNTADSAMLIAVRGIGERTVMSIMEYRRRLGGFADVAQLAEVRGVTEQNFEMMSEQIYVDPAVIQKIDINFAPAKSLAEHPYISASALRKLLKQRQLKGGWRTPEELAEDNIFTAEELTKLGPYLIFKPISN